MRLLQVTLHSFQPGSCPCPFRLLTAPRRRQAAACAFARYMDLGRCMTLSTCLRSLAACASAAMAISPRPPSLGLTLPGLLAPGCPVAQGLHWIHRRQETPFGGDRQLPRLSLIETALARANLAGQAAPLALVENGWPFAWRLHASWCWWSPTPAWPPASGSGFEIARSGALEAASRSWRRGRCGAWCWPTRCSMPWRLERIVSSGAAGASSW